MNTTKKSLKQEGFFLGFLICIILASIFLVLSFLLPNLISSNYYQKSLDQLRNQAGAINHEFANLTTEIGEKQKLLLLSPLPTAEHEILSLLKKIDFSSEKEGIGYHSKGGDLILWLGNVVDLNFFFTQKQKDEFFQSQKNSLLIQNKASVYLVSLLKLQNGESVIFYRLLAFIPELKTSYLKEYHFLRATLLRNCHIDYWDFRDDISGFDKIFSRHKDEYIGQPRLRDEIQTLLFPLRSENRKIVATVTLTSPSISAKLTDQKENLLLIFYLLLGASLISLLIHLVKSPSFHKERKILSGFFVILTLAGLRFIFFPLSELEKFQALPFFSPSSASFLSFLNLTKSPADIFLSSFFLFLIMACLIFYSRSLFEGKKRKPSLPLSLIINLTLVFVMLVLIFIFQEILFNLVFHSNINLLRFSFNPSFFLLHLSIFLLFFVFFHTIFIGMKITSLFSSNFFLPLAIFLLEFGGYIFLFKEKYFPLLFLFQALVILLIITLAFFPKIIKRKRVLFSALLLFALFIYISLNDSSTNHNYSLIQNSLQNIIKSQEHWGAYLLSQSLPEIEKRKESILSFFHNSEPSDFAHSLWKRTLVAKFNWYSSLEILNPEGKILSHFALNVPYRSDFDFPPNKEWSISQMNIPLMGEEKDFLIGYKDFFEEEKHLGRMIFYLSIDYDMLPFLYSANPYFELIRVSSIPSLNQFDIGFSIFDTSGKLLFNPNKISSGLPPALLERIITSKDHLWTSFSDKKKKYHSFYFRKNDRIYSLFIPIKNFITYSVEFLKLFFFYFIFFLFFLFLVFVISGKKFRNPFWSFSNRVYISFVAIAFIPLLLFTFFTRGFFSRIFTQQITEKAEAHANFAQRVMDDFIFLQQEEMASLTIPPEDVVLWISNTISNDVNLYQNGRLISSSRREFFDSGLLPDLIDGETYYNIQYENNPFYTQTQKIGDYSFHTLTIPYYLGNSLIHISLPFPLEQQEISKATEDLIDFLFFISVFFIAVVLIFARGIGHMIVTPIKKLLKGTEEVSLGNLEISIRHNPQDEMKTLIDGFNTMVKNLKQHQQELAEMSKKVAGAEMARKVAHEIKNPLTPIQLSAEHLLRVYEDKKGDFDQTLKESASYIIKEVEHLRRIAQEFLKTSKETTFQKERFNLKDLIQETIVPYKKMLSERILFEETFEGQDFNFAGDKSKIKIALRGIFTNAIEAIQGKGKIEVKANKIKTELLLEIKDTGTGMEKKVLNKIFEPYFSTKNDGTGLGLPIAKKIIEDHGGTIKAISKVKAGTKIQIRLPETT